MLDDVRIAIIEEVRHQPPGETEAFLELAHEHQPRVRGQGQVAAGILSEEDARAINAPLRAQRENLKLRLACLPERRALLAPEKLDPAKFRAAVLVARSAQPLPVRREALERLVERITLSNRGAHVYYRFKHGPIGRHQPEPPGPP